jgi:hypothetical protein
VVLRARAPSQGDVVGGRQELGCRCAHDLVALGAMFSLAVFLEPMSTAANWSRSLAVSLVSSGMGVAPITISPFARWLISTCDWRTAMLSIGILAWTLLLPAALLVRRGGHVRCTGLPPSAVPGSRVDLLCVLRGPLGTDLSNGKSQ